MYLAQFNKTLKVRRPFFIRFAYILFMFSKNVSLNFLLEEHRYSES